MFVRGTEYLLDFERVTQHWYHELEQFYFQFPQPSGQGTHNSLWTDMVGPLMKIFEHKRQNIHERKKMVCKQEHNPLLLQKSGKFGGPGGL